MRTIWTARKSDMEAQKLKADAKLLEQAGYFAVTLEKILAALAEEIASCLTIPVIGIGAGQNVDGQVLVVHDMLGLNQDFLPKFVRSYATLGETVTKAASEYITDVKKQRLSLCQRII